MDHADARESDATPLPRRYRLPRASRMSGRVMYGRAYDNGVRVSRGPLVAVGVRNDAGVLRMGLSVPRRVGTAPVRNRVKRMLREAFRHFRAGLEAEGMDVVVNVKPHAPLILAEYQKLLSALMLGVRRKLADAGEGVRP